MKLTLFVITFLLAASMSVFAADPPAWAYGFTTPLSAGNAGGPGGGRGPGGGGRGGSGRGAAPAPNNEPLHLEGSTLEFTRQQVNDGYGPADWFPGDHPTMPDIVAHGRRPEIRACSLCHYPNGQGRAENAGVNGFPPEYFLEQLKEFADGDRKSTDTRKANTNAMAAIAKAMTPEERKAAADYYAAIPFKQWIQVKESTTAPKTRTNVGLFLALEGNETEPLGDRIIEVPVSAEQTETYRNPRSGFIAYVPMGSVRKGEALAKSGQCATCHGADLRGLGPVPSIAGRSPSYMMRQLYDMQQGNRKGLWTALMKPVVAPLSQDDMLDLVAYVASLKP
ncbi:MAG TPA: c-type cytochrome [Bryobacteraceae bacterium]|nr:c-type cytochrome [Bryobacteraceae bacterium]